MKPDFTTNDINCDNVLQCLFNLSQMDEEIMSILEEGKEYRSKELAEELGKDQSTVYRSLEKLVSCGLIYKEKQTIRKGGYYYLYSARPKEKIQEEAIDCLEDWYSKMKSAINRIEDI